MEVFWTTTQSNPSPQIETSHEGFVWWSGVWRLPLYLPRIPSHLLSIFVPSARKFYSVPIETWNMSIHPWQVVGRWVLFVWLPTQIHSTCLQHKKMNRSWPVCLALMRPSGSATDNYSCDTDLHHYCAIRRLLLLPPSPPPPLPYFPQGNEQRLDSITCVLHSDTAGLCLFQECVKLGFSFVAKNICNATPSINFNGINVQTVPVSIQYIIY